LSAATRIIPWRSSLDCGPAPLPFMTMKFIFRLSLDTGRIANELMFHLRKPGHNASGDAQVHDNRIHPKAELSTMPLFA
jgi:hypothetical protein